MSGSYADSRRRKISSPCRARSGWLRPALRASGGIYLINSRDKSTMVAYPGAGTQGSARREDLQLVPGRAGRGGESEVPDARPLDLAAGRNSVHTLYVVHARRPRVGRGVRGRCRVRRPPALTWIGCAVAPDPIGLELGAWRCPTAASSPPTSWRAASMPRRAARCMAGEKNGALWEWHTGTGWTEGSGQRSGGRQWSGDLRGRKMVLRRRVGQPVVLPAVARADAAEARRGAARVPRRQHPVGARRVAAGRRAGRRRARSADDEHREDQSGDAGGAGDYSSARTAPRSAPARWPSRSASRSGSDRSAATGSRFFRRSNQTGGFNGAKYSARRPASHDHRAARRSNAVPASAGAARRPDQGEGGERSDHSPHVGAELLQAAAGFCISARASASRPTRKGTCSSTPQRRHAAVRVRPERHLRQGDGAWASTASSSRTRCASIAQDNVWVVDEGTNMVIKFNPEGRVVMVLGRRPEPVAGAVETPQGDPPPAETIPVRPADRRRWDPQGNIFVSDGYVNSRVVKYDKNGRFIAPVRRRPRGDGAEPVQHAALDRRRRAGQRLRRRSRQRAASQVFEQRPDAASDLRQRRQSVGGLHLARAASVPVLVELESRQRTRRRRGRSPARSTRWSSTARSSASSARPAKALGEFSTVHEIDCRNPDQLFVSEISAWRAQKIILSPSKMQPATSSAAAR